MERERDVDFGIMTVKKIKFSRRVSVEFKKQRNDMKPWGPEVMAERRTSYKETDTRERRIRRIQDYRQQRRRVPEKK